MAEEDIPNPVERLKFQPEVGGIPATAALVEVVE